MRLLPRLAVGVAAAAVAAAVGARAGCTNVEAPDGVPLSTCVWWSDDSKPKPALLDRSPYSHVGLELLAVVFGLLEGMVGLAQDQRGTGSSGGNFSIWHNAGTDGRTTVDWAANQSWCDGNVYTIGASADGLAELMDFADPSPALAGQVVVFAGANGYPILYPGGAYRQGLSDGWLQGTVPAQAPALIAEVRARETYDAWWEKIDMTSHFANVDWPMVMWAGWYDIFSNENLITFESARAQCKPEVRDRISIVVDPLGHCQHASKYFPKNLIAGRAVLPILQAWDLFKNETKRAEGAKAVTYYVMGPYDAGAASRAEADAAAAAAPGNYWTTLDSFPTFVPTDYYFGVNGTLSTQAPAGGGSATGASFLYDPSDPVPTIGGNNLELPCGPSVQNANEARADVMTFTTEPLDADVYVTGPLEATLYVSSNATDTDFTAMLTDVYPNGDSRQIQDGIVRMRWRGCANSGCSGGPQAMEDGTVYEVTVTLWNTSYAFAAGHSIRVDVSSSNYPRFSANRNVAQTLDGTKPAVVAENTVHFDSRHPSRITLPVVTAAQQPPSFILLEDGSVRFSDIPDYDDFVRRAAVFEDYLALRAKGGL